MTEMKSYPPGAFCWDELATSDGNAARKFYTSLFGWKANESPMGPDQPPYVMLEKSSKPVAALYENKKTRPHWNSYVSVSNVDDAAKKAKSLGARILAEPFDVMDVGRMATIQDPQGASLCLWQPKKHIGAMVIGEPNTMCWNELTTRDVDGAHKFYTALFGWKLKISPEYTEIYVGDRGVGGVFPMPKEMGDTPPYWMPYVMVTDCDGMTKSAKSSGATVHVGPQDIPGIGRFSVMSDPQGAMFAIIKVQQQP
ncbi:MAG TPA: VOC family protein [Thermoanaerobaculia bacterium]|jgi:predicted enzyme related to lactoylglutathione lyase